MLRRTTEFVLLACLSLLPLACDSTEYDAEYAEPVGPPDGAVFDTDDVIVLLWDPAPQAGSYFVQVSPDVHFADSVTSQRIGITTAEIGPLKKGTYHWRIMALELGRDEGVISPSRFFIVEDRRILDLRTSYGFSFTGADLAGLHAEIASADSSAIRAELARLGIPNAEIRAIMPRTVSARLEEPRGTTLNRIGSLDFLLGDASGVQQTAAVLNTPPLSTYAPMTIVTDSIQLGTEPRGILQITPTPGVPPGSYQLSVEVNAQVVVVVP